MNFRTNKTVALKTSPTATNTLEITSSHYINSNIHGF